MSILYLVSWRSNASLSIGIPDSAHIVYHILLVGHTGFIRRIPCLPVPDPVTCARLNTGLSLFCSPGCALVGVSTQSGSCGLHSVLVWDGSAFETLQYDIEREFTAFLTVIVVQRSEIRIHGLCSVTSDDPVQCPHVPRRKGNTSVL